MRHVYVFNHTSKGAVYGVGTYIDQLFSLMHNDFIMHVVYLHSDTIEVSVQMINGVEVISFPNPVLVPIDKISREDYHTNVIRILRHYIDVDADNIFHLNYLDLLHLAKSIKQYLHGKIVFAIHYSQSLFKLQGNITRLHEIAASLESDEGDKASYATIRNEIINVRQIVNNYADKVISVTRHSYLQNKEIYRVGDDKNILVHNALCDVFPKKRPSKQAVKNKLGINYTGKIILFAGRLDELKGLHCLLQALTLLKKKGYDFHLFVAGKGKFGAAMNFVQGLYTNITFTGFLNKNELYQFFHLADLGVIPSMYEEFGYVALEMMMYRLPVVAFNTSGPAEIIKDGHTGLLAELLLDQPDTTIWNLADKIAYLLDHPKECKQMGRAGRERFLKFFTASIFKEKMSYLYSSL